MEWHKNDFENNAWYKKGVVGIESESDNAHQVQVLHFINGSGSDSFGGADKWPGVKCEVSFQKGDEKKAFEFAKKLKAFIDKEVN